MGVAAYEGLSRKGEPVFRSYHMDYTVFGMHKSEKSQAELGCVSDEGVYLVAGHRIGYR